MKIGSSAKPKPYHYPTFNENLDMMVNKYCSTPAWALNPGCQHGDPLGSFAPSSRGGASSRRTGSVERSSRRTGSVERSSRRTGSVERSSRTSDYSATRSSDDGDTSVYTQTQSDATGRTATVSRAGRAPPPWLGMIQASHNAIDAPGNALDRGMTEQTKSLDPDRRADVLKEDFQVGIRNRWIPIAGRTCSRRIFR